MPFFVLLILVAVASRFLPHLPNVTCVGAIGLFAGCYLSGRRAYLVPLAALFLSDLVGQWLRWPGMGFYQPVTMMLVYAGAVAAVPIGRMLHGRPAVLRWVPLGSLAASTVFYLLSNLGVWFAGWYSLSFAGLLACYVSAIPFFGYTIAGDLVFSLVLFGVWELSRLSRPAAESLAAVKA